MVGHFYVFAFVLDRSHDLVCSVYLQLFLLTWLVVSLTQQAVLQKTDSHFPINCWQSLSLHYLKVLVHELNVGLVRYYWPVYVGEWLCAVGTAAGLFSEKGQCLRVLSLVSSVFLRVIVERAMADECLNALIELLQLLLVLQTGFLDRCAERGTLVVCVLEGLVFNFNGNVGFLEEGAGSVIYAVFSLLQRGQSA